MLVVPRSQQSALRYLRTKSPATCWKLTLTSGTILRFTDWPHALSIREADSPSLQVYTPNGGLDGSAVRRTDQLESQNRETRGILDGDTITVADLRAGRYDGAQIDEFIVNARYAFMGHVSHERYFIKSVSYSNGIWNAEVDGIVGYLELPVGETWGPTCRVDVFSTKCGLNKVSFGTALAVTDILIARRSFKFTMSAIVGSPWRTSPGYGNDGTIDWTGGVGPHSGIIHEIKEYTYDSGSSKGTVVLHAPSQYDISVGDSASIYPGCNKKSGTEKDLAGNTIAGHCYDRYNNVINFQGEPNIPGRDRAFKTIPVR